MLLNVHHAMSPVTLFTKYLPQFLWTNFLFSIVTTKKTTFSLALFHVT